GLASGLLLGSMVRVQVAGEMLVHEPFGIQVLDLEVGELWAQPFPQVAFRALGDLAQVAEGAAGLGGDLRQLVRPEDDKRDHHENQQLKDGQVKHRSALSWAAACSRDSSSSARPIGGPCIAQCQELKAGVGCGQLTL